MSSYSLEALVGRPDVVDALPPELTSAGRVELGEGLALVPVPLEMLRHLYSDEPVLDAVRDMLGAAAAAASHAGPLAYLHAELFEGEGSEGALVWEAGDVVFEAFEDPAHDVGPIDRGLAVLGVAGGPGQDAFDLLGLGRHHTLDEWLRDARAHAP